MLVLVTPPQNWIFEISASFPATGYKLIIWPPAARDSSSIITVALVPAPFKETPLRVSVCVQIFVPAGNWMMSPGEALATALVTSENRQVTALNKAARLDCSIAGEAAITIITGRIRHHLEVLAFTND